VNSLFLETGEVDKTGFFSLQGARAQELFDAHGSASRKNMKASICANSRGSASIKLWSRQRIEGFYVIQHEPLQKFPITLLIGAARPQATKRIISLSIQMGVANIYFVLTSRAEKNYLSSKVFDPEKMRTLVRRSLEQSEDSTPPEIKRYWSLEAALSDIQQSYQTVQLHCADTEFCLPLIGRDYWQQISPSSDHQVIAIGPEAGWGEVDREILVKYGAGLFGLGERILTVDVAVSYALSVMKLRLCQS
jgi:16S rRNA (uracil1498-N3)-methyltransferase